MLDVRFEIVDGQAIGATKDVKITRKADFVIAAHALACDQLFIFLATTNGFV